jgi:hypothetical protein
MKKILVPLALTLSLSAYADPQFSDISKKDVEDVAKEMGTNFAHTVVAAPETDGAWGIEVGVIGGQTKSPKFSDVVEASGGDGKDFKNVYHGAAIARVHVPFDIFVEASYLPEQTISSVKVKNQTFGVGWNAGAFFGWGFDVAIGYDHSDSQIKFHQDQDLATTTPEANIKLNTINNVLWVGVSKSFVFVTPYAKIGKASIEGDLDADAQIFNVSGKTSQKVSTDGNFLALGVNFQLTIVKLGAEFSQIQGVQRLTGKLSLDF